MNQAITTRAMLFSVGLAIAAMLIGAEYVRAAGGHYDGESGVEQVSTAASGAAELDPAFVQKLAGRWRRQYERSYQAAAQR